MLQNRTDYDLFNREFAEITYQDVLSFCEVGHEEDIDLDYKKTWPNDLARVICSFANTQGGLVLIGIDEDGKTRRPKCPPIGVQGSEPDLRQRAMNIAFDGVYPPVEPDVAAVQLPDIEDKYVVLIRVHPSRIMHATDRRTRIYVRSTDSNRGYELASLQELGWLSEERKKSTELRQIILNQANSRSVSPAIAFEDADAAEKWLAGPSLLLSILPEFPGLKAPINLRDLFDVINNVGKVKSDWPNIDRWIPWRTDQWRTVPGAVALTSRGMSPLLHYVEVGSYGHAYFRYYLEARPASTIHQSITDNRNVIHADVVLSYFDIAVRFTSFVFTRINQRWPVFIDCRITESENTLLDYNVLRTNYLARRFLSPACPNDNIDLVSCPLRADALLENLPSLLKISTTNLLWAYGIPKSVEQIDEWLAALTGSEKPS